MAAVTFRPEPYGSGEDRLVACCSGEMLIFLIENEGESCVPDRTGSGGAACASGGKRAGRRARSPIRVQRCACAVGGASVRAGAAYRHGGAGGRRPRRPSLRGAGAGPRGRGRRRSRRRGRGGVPARHAGVPRRPRPARRLRGTVSAQRLHGPPGQVPARPRTRRTAAGTGTRLPAGTAGGAGRGGQDGQRPQAAVAHAHPDV